MRLRKCDGDVRLAGVNDYLWNIFKFVGADDHFETYDSVENAVRSFEEED